MSNSPGIFEDLMVIPTLESLIAKEVNLVESFTFDVLEGIGFIPSCKILASIVPKTPSKE